jgi:hypothetical protein
MSTCWAIWTVHTSPAATRQEDENNIKDALLQDIAIAELVSYIFETQRNSTESVVFRLIALVSMYE